MYFGLHQTLKPGSGPGSIFEYNQGKQSNWSAMGELLALSKPDTSTDVIARSIHKKRSTSVADLDTTATHIDGNPVSRYVTNKGR